MSVTTTNTTTRTVIDIRKTFESFAADLDMIAGRTRKWDTAKVDSLAHDILRLAELSYLSTVDIVLRNTQGHSVRATKYIVNENGSLLSGDRAGTNSWPCLPDTVLTVVVDYSAKWKGLTTSQQEEFMKGQINSWGRSTIDTSYPNLRRETAQQYATNGYELSKTNFV